MEGKSAATIEVVEEELIDPFFTEDFQATGAGRGSAGCDGCFATCSSCTRAVPMPTREVREN